MSFYNMVHGVNPLSGLLMAALGVSHGSVPRFRDCWWDGAHIAIHTRTGGGNRPYYESEDSCRANYPEYFDGGSDQPKGPWNVDLRAIPGYSHDEDDDYDSTYATFYFKPSPALMDALSHVSAQDATPAQRWQGFMDRLGSGSDDPQVSRVKDAMRPVLDALSGMVNEEPVKA